MCTAASFLEVNHSRMGGNVPMDSAQGEITLIQQITEKVKNVCVQGGGGELVFNQHLMQLVGKASAVRKVAATWYSQRRSRV